uniref:KRAB domain-containing protein n=1 Tax=Naja naja TaxID=35670 RepID=A0A8C6VIG3_NAJNA
LPMDVHFTSEEWLLLDSRQKTLHREVMLETCRIMSSLGKDVYITFIVMFYLAHWLTLKMKFCCLLSRASIYPPIYTYIIHIYTCCIHTYIYTCTHNKQINK